MIYGYKFINFDIAEDDGVNILVGHSQFDKYHDTDVLLKLKEFASKNNLHIAGVIDKEQEVMYEVIVGLYVDGTLTSIQDADGKLHSIFDSFDRKGFKEMVNYIGEPVNKEFMVYQYDILGRDYY